MGGNDHVGWHEAVDEQGHSSDVTLLQSGLIQSVDRLRAGGERSADGLIDLRAGGTCTGLKLVFEEGQRSDVGWIDVLARQIFQCGGITGEGVFGGGIGEVHQLGGISEGEESAAVAAEEIHFDLEATG